MGYSLWGRKELDRTEQLSLTYSPPHFTHVVTHEILKQGYEGFLDYVAEYSLFFLFPACVCMLNLTFPQKFDKTCLKIFRHEV